MELMSPAGSLESAKAAFSNGADSIYAGFLNLSMRPKRVEFTDDSFENLLAYSRSIGKKVYAVTNVYFKHQDLSYFYEKFDHLASLKPDAVIIADVNMITWIKKNYPEIPVHVSIQTSVVNVEAAKFYESLGADVIVISRSLDDKDELRRIRAGVKCGIEVFVHGGICYMFDGNCMMSSYWKQEWGHDEALGIPRLLGQNNTKGECHLVCKRNCGLEVGGVLQSEGRLMRRPDMVGLADLPFYIDLGVKILKIEGRAMPLYYIEEATRLYREAIDLYKSDPEKFSVAAEWEPRIERLLEARHEYEKKWHIG